jgi:ribonuclease BN (tRNA processing enzyme)
VTDGLTVLGSCGAWPEPHRACSGFLVERDGFRVVLDLGYGTLPRLLDALGPQGVDALDGVVVTHHHPDHAVDLHGLFRAWTYPRRSWERLAVWAPPQVRDAVIALEDGDAAAVDAAFDFTPLPAGPTAAGPFVLESVALPHFVPSVGVRLSSPGLVVAYTGDTGPSPALAELGRDADLFVVEATDREQRPTTPPARKPGLQLTSTEAGRAARSAAARRLLLTHFWPGNDRERSRANAQAEYGGEVLLADEGLRIDLP